MSSYYIQNNVQAISELYNSSTDIINLRDVALVLFWEADNTQEVYELSESDVYLASKAHTVVSIGGTVPNASVQFESSLPSGTSITQMQLQVNGYKPYDKVFSTNQSQRMMLGETSTGCSSTKCFLVDTRQNIYDSGLYAPSTIDFPLAPIEISANPRQCSPTDTSLSCTEYVKFYNYTQEAVNFADTRLRIGYQGQTESSSNTVALSGTVQPGEYAIFHTTTEGAPLSITNSGGFVWLEDRYGLVHYPNTSCLVCRCVS